MHVVPGLSETVLVEFQDTNLRNNDGYVEELLADVPHHCFKNCDSRGFLEHMSAQKYRGIFRAQNECSICIVKYELSLQALSWRAIFGQLAFSQFTGSDQLFDRHTIIHFRGSLPACLVTERCQNNYHIFDCLCCIPSRCVSVFLHFYLLSSNKFFTV